MTELPDPSKPWYDQPINKVDPYQLKPPYDNVWVGPYPSDGMTKEFATSFQAIVNVSTTPDVTFEPAYTGQSMHWYPCIELGRWSVGYLYWLVKVLDHHHEKGHKIYLHCAAGAFRSPSAAILWLESRGHTPDEAMEIGHWRGREGRIKNHWARQGNIPALKDELFAALKKHPTYAVEAVGNHTWSHEFVSGLYRRNRIKEDLLWFYYQPKYTINSFMDKVKYWLKGYGWTTTGYCTYYYGRRYWFEWGKDAEPLEWNESSDKLFVDTLTRLFGDPRDE